MSRQKSFSKEKYEERIQNQINVALKRDISDPRLMMISITRVELSPDKSWAKVYWDTYNTEHKEEVKAAIEKSAGKLRSVLAKTLNVRHTPEIQFLYDSQFEDENHIMDLLKNEDV